jgi:hypothetical protein
MTRKLNGIALAAVAVLVCGAVTASTAGAAELHSTSSHTILSGSQTTEHVFTVGAGFGSVKCKKVTLSGTTASTTTAETVLQISRGECTDSFGRTVHEKCEGVHRKKETWFGLTEHTECIGVSTTQVTSGGSVICTVTYGNQTNSKISASNSGSGVLLKWELTNISTTTSGGFFNCGVSDGAHTGGSYTGSSLITGVNTEGKAVTVSYS